MASYYHSLTSNIFKALENRCNSIDENITSSRWGWDELPQDIIELICGKLPCYTDQTYFRAVCMSWRVPKTSLRRCSKSRPWLINLENSSLFDPCSQKVYKVLNSLEKLYSVISFRYFMHRVMNQKNIYVYASKNGWLLLNFDPLEKLIGWLVLYNPFLDDSILLPPLDFRGYEAATFTTDPKSPDCEVLVLCNKPVSINNPNPTTEHYIARYCKARGKEWKIKHIGTMSPDSKAHYMKGKLYCLSQDGLLKSYNLKDESLELVWQHSSNSGNPISSDSFSPSKDEMWFTEYEENLIVICRKNCPSELHPPWVIYRFDWLQKVWVSVTSLKNTAIFVRSQVAMLTSLVDGDGKKMDDCIVCYLQRGLFIEAYSMKEMKRVSSKHYWDFTTTSPMAFIEPPLLSN